MALQREVVVHVNEHGQRINLVDIEARLLQIAADKDALRVQLAMLQSEESALMVQRHKIMEPFAYEEHKTVPPMWEKFS